MSYVVKRSGRTESIAFDKITARITKLCFGLDARYVDPVKIAQKVIVGVHSGITSAEIDTLAAETAAYMTTHHPDFSTLAARIAVSNLHRETATNKHFSSVVKACHEHVNPKTGQSAPLVSRAMYDDVMANEAALDSAIIYDRDYRYSYFGFKTLERSYLLRIDGRIVERPQHMIMRVAVGIHGKDLDAVLESYHYMSGRFFTHATPTLFNAGTVKPQMSSCFLMTMESDSIDGIFNTVKQCALISKYAGGIGLNVHDIRAKGAGIASTNGTSNGIVPMLRVFNSTARYVDQGGNKRAGAFAVYIEPWHAEIFEFLELKKNTGKEEVRARDLFYGLWVPDRFMRMVETDGDWHLFCPSVCRGLADAHGEGFDSLYEACVREGKATRVVKARKLWYAILDVQIETGTPYMVYKDAANQKSNQKNLGTIRCSNLCTEIIQYSSPEEIACCNLASLALPSFVRDDRFDFDSFRHVVRVVTKNLNRVIDVNHYPLEQARSSNMRHRPISLGVQGLADVFILMRLPFESAGAATLNRDIFECMYHAALDASCELAERDGVYDSYAGSPASEGILQHDMWPKQETRIDWTELRARIKKHGLRNSLLVGLMPTASTSQILGNNEACEPYTSNIYTRRVLSGEFQVVNHHLLTDLSRLGLWNEGMRNRIVENGGSIQAITSIPKDIRELYKTVWEIPQRCIIDMSAARAPYVDQSQSLNIFMMDPSHSALTSMHFYGWKKGLKTGMYYLRTRPAADPIKFTVDKAAASKAQTVDDALACSRDNPDCQSCSG